MEQEQILRLAEDYAKAKGWDFHQPVQIKLKQRWFSRQKYWWVFSNAECRGRNVMMEVSAEDGSVLKAAYLRR